MSKSNCKLECKLEEVMSLWQGACIIVPKDPIKNLLKRPSEKLKKQLKNAILKWYNKIELFENKR